MKRVVVEGTEKCLINYVRKHLALVRNLVVSQLQANPSGTLFHYSSEIFMGSNSPCLVSIRSSHILIFQEPIWSCSGLPLFCFLVSVDVINKG